MLQKPKFLEKVGFKRVLVLQKCSGPDSSFVEKYLWAND